MSALPPNTARLKLPYIQPSQAQKHVTHNEALRLLDALVQLCISAFDALTPPASPNEGTVYALADTPTGVWAGHGGELALFDNGGWQFIPAQEGWIAVDLTGGPQRIFRAGTWEARVFDTDNLDGVGIGGTADATNRLLVQSPASLFNHTGNGHQIKINKAAVGDTASLVFQTGFSGRAEMGLAGNDDWAIKTSADGGSWTTALSLDAASGIVSGAAVQSSADDIQTGKLMRADYGYCPGNLLGAVSQTGGQPTGAVIERGSTGDGTFIKFADGTLICHHLIQVKASADTAPGVKTASWTLPAGFAAADYAMSITLQTASPDGRGPASYSTATTASVDVHYHEVAGTGDAISAQVTAIGRWF